MDIAPFTSRCRRCDDLRQQMLMVRVVHGGTEAWRCPDCGIAWAPVTFASALATADRPRLDSVGLPTPCPCPARGPFTLVRLMSDTHEWTWLCNGCGAGQDARLRQ